MTYQGLCSKAQVSFTWVLMCNWHELWVWAFAATQTNGMKISWKGSAVLLYFITCTKRWACIETCMLLSFCSILTPLTLLIFNLQNRMVLKQGMDGSLWYKVLEKQEAVKFKDLGPEQMMVYQVSYLRTPLRFLLSQQCRCKSFCSSSYCIQTHL